MIKNLTHPDDIKAKNKKLTTFGNIKYYQNNHINNIKTFEDLREEL